MQIDTEKQVHVRAAPQSTGSSKYWCLQSWCIDVPVINLYSRHCAVSWGISWCAKDFWGCFASQVPNDSLLFVCCRVHILGTWHLKSVPTQHSKCPGRTQTLRASNGQKIAHSPKASKKTAPIFTKPRRAHFTLIQKIGVDSLGGCPLDLMEVR